MDKVVVLDIGFYTHKAIFSYSGDYRKKIIKKAKEIKLDYDKEKDYDIFLQAKKEVDYLVASHKLWVSPSPHTYFNMLMSGLKKIGITKNDTIIMAEDGRSSWRKAFYLPYKGNREELRGLQKDVIDWTEEYSKIDKINQELCNSTDWQFIQLSNIFNYADLILTNEGQRLKIEDYGTISYDKEFGIESDDIQAVACRYFKDKEVTLVTIDEDLSQLCYYNNTKIFNPNLKSPTNKAKKGFYKIIDEPLKIKSKKIRLGDKSDNILVDKKKDSIRDVEIRQVIIDLIKLPDFIENPIINALDELDWNKKIQYDKLPFQNSLAKKFDTIYDQKNIRTMEESIIRHILKEMKEIEKRSTKTSEELYEKNLKYKKLKDDYNDCKTLEKVKV